MDVSAVLVRTLSSRGFRVDSVLPEASDRFQITAYKVKSNESVLLSVQVFHALDQLQAQRQQTENTVRVLHPKVVRYSRAFDYKVDTDLWVLGVEYEAMTGSLSSVISQRRKLNSPWTAEELFQFLVSMLEVLADAQRNTVFLTGLTVMNVYTSTGGEKLPADGWACEGRVTTGKCPYKAATCALGIVVLQMAALKDGFFTDADLCAVIGKLTYPKWLKYFIQKMTETVDSLRPDLLSLLGMIAESSTAQQTGCVHLLGDAEGGEGCEGCGKFYCALCEVSVEGRLCLDCQGKRRGNPRLLSLARTPDGTGICDGCRVVMDEEDIVTVNDGIAGKFCLRCLQTRFNDHEMVERCRKSSFTYLFHCLQQSL